MSGGVGRRQRSPPGSWRVLAPAIAAWATTATAVALPGSARWIAVVAATGGGAALLLGRLGGGSGALGRRVVQYAGLLCAVLLVLGVRIEAEERIRADPPLSASAAVERPIGIDVVLDGYPEVERTPLGERMSVRALASGTQGRVPVLLWFGEVSADEAAGWAPGEPIRVVGVPVALRQPSAAAFGVRVERHGVDPRAEPSVDPRAEPSVAHRVAPGAWATSDRAGGGDWFARASAGAAGLRAGLRDASAEVIGAELVPGMAVGDTALVGEELEELLRDSSLLHLLAVSGANCALITGALIRGAALCGAGRRARLVVAGAGLAAFVGVVGPDASVRRAAVMACVMLASRFGGKRAAALPGLGIAILVLLVQDPWQAVHAGFALSVSATAGILLLVPRLSEGIRRLVPAPAWLVLPIAVALAAQLACGPLLLLLQPGIPASGILANVIAGPAAPLGTALGLLAMLVLPIWPQGGTLILTLASLPARWVASTARICSELPLARWPWPQGWAGAALLAAVELALLAAWMLLAGRIGTRSGQAAGGASSRFGGRRPWADPAPAGLGVRLGAAMLLCGAAGGLVGPTVVAPVVSRAGTPDDWVVVACDVGQGDALLIRDPAERSRTMLVDTGDDPALLDACLERFGVARISMLVLTHDDRDHVGALGSVVDRVDEAVVAPDNLEDGTRRPVLARLRRAGVPFAAASTGMAGAFSERGLAWRVLAPDADAHPADTNAASVVMRVEAGGAAVLLLADTGAAEHGRLLRRGSTVDPSLLRADVVKVAHHGSADADAALYERAGAAYGLVSVGAGNGYGHPAPETLSALARSGTAALRTDLLGSIALHPDPDDTGLGAWAERGARQ